MRCRYCKRTLEPPGTGGCTYTRDHVYPKSLGGKKTVPCCRACNELKADKTPEEWQAFRAKNPEWWRLWNFGTNP